MQPNSIVGVATVSLLIVAFCQIVVAQFHQCTGGETCISINECPRFGPHYHEPSKWSGGLLNEFRSKVCKREQSNGRNLYKVCCKRAATDNKNNRERGLATLDLEECGAYSADRIAFGQEARLFEFPWMALLMPSSGQFVCGGTLINRRYVLTAAHCIKNTHVTTVRLGEFDLSTLIDYNKRGDQHAPPPQDIAIEQTIVHEAYNGRLKVNDIGLIRLAEEAAYNDNVSPICLPVSPAMRTKQTTYFVAGWGATESGFYSNRLLFGKVTLLPNDQCVQQLQRLDSYAKINNGQMCAIGANLTDNCTGDSGGPLKTISINARYVQYGVVSLGLRTCGKQSAPGVYTRVENYADWILEHLEE
uniref:Peptidase S1 domain-containing protein n=1 Tax=Anopheles quadriannulatus TaxID=34691 RepID=A0A2Y9D3Z2_ANOQN